MPLNRACLLLLLLCGAAACTRTRVPVETLAPAARRPEHGRVGPDVVALLSQSIDQVRQRLGPPRETRDMVLGPEPTPAQLRTQQAEEWINTFEREQTTIVVTFNARTRKVRDLVLLGPDEDVLMRRAGLELVDERYLALPVADPAEPSKTIGVRVVAR